MNIMADGVILAEKLVRAMDVSGNFVVGIEDFTYDDVFNDYNGDGFSNLVDLALFNNHAALGHTCEAPVGDRNLTWGNIKALWR